MKGHPPAKEFISLPDDIYLLGLINTPNYACLKSDCKEACLGCGSVVLHEKGLCDCYVSDLGGSFFTFANIRPNAKAHCVMSSKKHIKDVRFMNMNIDEWNEILPVLKDTMKKIDKVYHPAGFRFTIPTGNLAGQNSPHFFARIVIVPKYKKSYGNEC